MLVFSVGTAGIERPGDYAFAEDDFYAEFLQIIKDWVKVSMGMSIVKRKETYWLNAFLLGRQASDADENEVG